ncbi:MAG: type IV pilus modification protein PilV [Undibacterium sp.]|nr:type IV pilus modification protein PilV [Undibacterium sp.]
MKKTFQSGVSLIEIMISILVMAVGLLGLAGLQINANKYLKSSGQRSEASDAAYDLSERMRANVTGLASYLANSKPYAAGSTDVPSARKVCNINTNSCSAADVAVNDMGDWYRSLQARLAGGSGFVANVPNTTVPTFDVTVMWKEQSLMTPDTTCPPAAAVPVGVRCFTYRVTP